MIDEPYFMQNDKWYYFDYKKRMYVLTEQATERAKKSYKEFYRELKKR